MHEKPSPVNDEIDVTKILKYFRIMPTTAVQGVRLAIAVTGLAAGPTATLAQMTAFRFDSSRVPVGQVFHYLKSNRDGSHASRVSVYIAAVDRIESYKWDSGGKTATLVVATMDWTRFSPARLEAFGVTSGKLDQPRARLEVRDGAFQISFLPDTTVAIGLWPWHSYDFDLASLSLAFPFLVDPRGRFTFRRFDVPPNATGPTFRNFGEVSVVYERPEPRLGANTNRYAIGGPGLNGTNGTLWIDARRGHLVEFEIPIPDEAGMRDGRLRLQAVAAMTAPQWEGFKRRGVGEP